MGNSVGGLGKHRVLSKGQSGARMTNKIDLTKGAVGAGAKFVAKADRFLKVDSEIDDLEYNASKEKIS